MKVVATEQGASEREQVMDFVWNRTNSAFATGDLVEARDLDRLHTVLGDLTDNEYQELYCDCDPSDF